jgi:transcription termination factor 2
MKVRWSDFVTNARILEMVKCGTIENMITRLMFRWLGHVKRMSDSRLAKQLLYGELQKEARRTGGQRKRYKDQCHIALKLAKIDKAWEASCSDRNLWRNPMQ